MLSCSALGWSFALFQKPHCGAFVRISWPHHGALVTILNAKEAGMSGLGIAVIRVLSGLTYKRG